MAPAAALLAAAPLFAQTSDNKPIDPFRIADDLYYVGSSDIGCVLLTSPTVHILIDAGYEETVPQIEANLAKLGFRLSDIKILLNSQAHFDHSGGFARLKRLTGARLIVSDEDAAIIERGGRGSPRQRQSVRRRRC
jgi:metallo-beta-lactamase class B